MKGILKDKRDLKNFQDPSLEGRRLFAEFWGTFLAVLVTVGAKVIAAKTGQISLEMMALARGLVVTIIIYFMGSVSGAHLNPIVTLGFALRRNFPWARVPGYLIVQLIGAFAAVFFARLILGTEGQMGASTPGEGASAFQAFIMEILLTVGLINTILGTAYEGRNIGAGGGIAVGGYITLASLWSYPISGASMNPFRSLPPDCLRGQYDTTWIYIIGPLLGMIIGVIFERMLRGAPAGGARKVAQGTGFK